MRVHSVGHRAVSAVLVLALLSFAHACAARGGLCETPGKARPAAAHAEADADGCGDQDGCGDAPAGDGAHASMCCSIWAPAPASPAVPASPLVSLATRTALPSLDPGTVPAAALAPSPTESPPPLVSFLRL